MSQNDAVNPHELTRLLDLWLIEEKTCEKYGLPRPTKKIITSSHVSPADEKSQEEIAFSHAGPKSANQPTYNTDLLARSLAYHQQSAQPPNPNKTKHRQSVNHIVSSQVTSKHCPQKQPRVKVDSAMGALEDDDGDQESVNFGRQDRPTSGIYNPTLAAKSMLSTASSNAGKKSTMLADAKGLPSLPGTSPLLSPSSTLNGSQPDSSSKSNRHTLLSHFAGRSPGLDSHLSLDYDSSSSGFSSPDSLAKSLNVHTLDTVLEQGGTARRGKERLVGRMDLKTGRYILGTTFESPGPSEGSRLSLNSPQLGSDPSRPGLRPNGDESTTDAASRIPGEERRANWAQDSDDEDKKESFVRKLRRRTLGVMHTGGEAPAEEKNNETFKQPALTAKSGAQTKEKLTEGKPPQRIIAQRSLTAPADVPQASDVPAPLRIREKSTRVKEHPYLAKAGPLQSQSKQAASEKAEVVTHVLSPTKSNSTKSDASQRPQFGLFPSTGTITSPPELQRNHSDKTRPGPISRIGQREPQNKVEQVQEKAAHDHRLSSEFHFTSLLPAPNESAVVGIPHYMAKSRTAAREPGTVKPVVRATGKSDPRGSEPPTALNSRAPSHNLTAPVSRGHPALPLMSEAELAKMTPESRALFKRQEMALRNRLNNTAVNSAVPSITPTVAPSIPNTAIHTARGSAVGLVPAAGPTTGSSPLRPLVNRTATPRSKAIAVPKMPRLHGRRPSDTPGARTTLPPLPNVLPPRQLANITQQSLRPVKSELMLSSRSPSTRSDVSQQAPSLQLGFSAATKPAIVSHQAESGFKTLPHHQHARTQSANEHVFTDKLPGLFGPSAARPDMQQTPVGNCSPEGNARKSEAPSLMLPSDVYNTEDADDFNSGLLSAEDGPGPTIEDPSYFEENVLKHSKQSSSGGSLSGSKSGFWRKMTVKKR